MKTQILFLALIMSHSAFAWDATLRTDQWCPFQGVIYSAPRKPLLLWSATGGDRIHLLHFRHESGSYSTYEEGTLPLGTPVFEADRELKRIELTLSGRQVQCTLESLR